MQATSASSWPSSPGLIPPGASPSSPFVHVTTTVRTPSSAYRASTPPVLDDSSSGCAWTAISVSGAVIRQAWHDVSSAATKTSTDPFVRHHAAALGDSDEGWNVRSGSTVAAELLGEGAGDGRQQRTAIGYRGVHGSGDHGVELRSPERERAPHAVVSDELRRPDAVAAESQPVVVVVTGRAGTPSGHLLLHGGAEEAPIAEGPKQGGEVRRRADEAASRPVDSRIHAGDVEAIEIVGHDRAAARRLVAALEPGVGHAGWVED